jgi:hypothetical protein
MVNYINDHVWDTDFIKGQIESFKDFKRLEEKYAFNTKTRTQFRIAATETLNFINELKSQYKEDYA